MRGNTTWSRTHIENNKNMKLYDWDYVSCPGVGHNSIGEAHCLGAYLSVFDNATETRDAMANEDFNPTLYYNMSSDFNLDRYGTPQICLNGHFGNDTSTGSIILYDDDIEAVSDYEDQGYFPSN